MGTLRVLGMEILQTDADTTTAYLQTYEPGRCSADCGFCAQAKSASSRSENIARGLYPPRETKEVALRLGRAYEKGLLSRACIQTMNYPAMLEDLLYLIAEIRRGSEIPISVSIYPLPEEKFRILRKAGVERIVIPLDTATKEIFEEIKGGKGACGYRWETHLLALSDAVHVYGKGRVGTHLIIGLGETEEEAVGTVQMLSYMGVYTSLFAYTPVAGTRLAKKQPEIGHYRRIQLAGYLIDEGISSFDKMEFKGGRITNVGILDDYLEELISSGEPFRTRGCPGCNRPYSTEQPGGMIYNYPLAPSERDMEAIKKQMGDDL